jgi:hypothetical protein
MRDSMNYPPVSHKKLHIPHRASQGRRNTEGDRVHYDPSLTEAEQSLITLIHYSNSVPLVSVNFVLFQST